MRRELRLAGEGGQGLITAAIILCARGAEHTDYNAVQSQSYYRNRAAVRPHTRHHLR